LLLPHGILLGDRTDKFQSRWFGQYRVEKIAQLSDLRFFLFPGADHPTVAVCFRPTRPGPNDRIDYLTPKASRASLADNVVAIEPEDHKSLLLSDILSSAARNEAA